MRLERPCLGLALFLGEDLDALLRVVERLLAEAAELDAAEWERFGAGRLDLTDQRDVVPLARLFSTVGWDFERVEEPVRQTLLLGPGGQRLAGGGEERLAARSFSSVSESERQRDIFRDRGTIDDSDAGREAAISSYLQALAKAMDEFS